MTKGSGRSACFRGGVTYGYRECLRKGRVRKSCDASSPANYGSTDLRRACSREVPNWSFLRLFPLLSKTPLARLRKIPFPEPLLRPYIEKYCRPLAAIPLPDLWDFPEIRRHFS